MNSPYNNKFKITQAFKGNAHKGLDLVGIDSKEIHATCNGIVEIARWENANNYSQGFGLYVMIHEDNTNRCYIYGHLSKILVSVGQRVSIGQVIGIEGTTGNSTGSHCHYECRNGSINGESLNICDLSGIPNNEGGIYSDNEYISTKVNVYYKVKTINYGWLPEVKNLEDYAGYKNDSITALAINVDEGSIKYRVHLKNKGWLPYVNGYDIYDFNNGFAGNENDIIDLVECYYYTPESIKPYKKAKYRVNDYDWQYDNEKINNQDGYAGELGVNATKFQIVIE